MSKYKTSDFEFVICAYGASPYLEECIISLKGQTVPVTIMLVTSTPNRHIEVLAAKYQLQYYINQRQGGMADDWNFGIRQAKGRIVTIAHQDDIYEPDFAATTIENINRQTTPLIAFTNYGELRNDKKLTDNRNLKIKRAALTPLKNRHLQKVRFVRRRILSLGNMICCPSVTYVKDNLTERVFASGFRSNIDWQAWERLSRQKGAFVYCSDILMYHRIHENSATTKIIADQDRAREDYQMFCQFWPGWIAGIIECFYRKGEDSNSLK